MLYSYKNQYPQQIPFRIVLSNGNTRTDPSSFTINELSDAGYVTVDNPPTIANTQFLSWNSESVNWVVRDKTEEELYLEYLATVPRTVTMRQARLALLQQGLLETVNAAITQGNDADKISWEYATEVSMTDPLVQNMTTSLSLTEQNLNELFILAGLL